MKRKFVIMILSNLFKVIDLIKRRTEKERREIC